MGAKAAPRVGDEHGILGAGRARAAGAAGRFAPRPAAPTPVAPTCVTAPTTRAELPAPLPVAAELLDRERDRLRPSLPAVPFDLLNDDPFLMRPTDHQRAEDLAVERLAHASGILDPEADQ